MRSKHWFGVAVALTLLSLNTEAQHNRNEYGNPPPEVFEAADRDEWQRPEWVLDQLALKPDAIVADLGAGSGYFSRRLAKRLPQGRVLALDIDPGMIDYIEKDAKRDGLTNIETRLIATDDPGLDPESVDVVFLSNTLHHISNRSDYYGKLVSALKPDGRLINIDFYKRDLPVGPRSLDHKLAKAVVQEEFTAACLFVSQDMTGLPYQYFLEASPLPPIVNAILLDARTVSSGEPTDEQLRRMADLGFRTVVNLQTEAEGSVEKGTIVKKLGMDFVGIPISSGSISEEQIDRFSAILTENDRYPMLIHCRSGNRVGGMFLLDGVLRQNKELETALQEARRAGLRSSLEERLLPRVNAQRE